MGRPLKENQHLLGQHRVFAPEVCCDDLPDPLMKRRLVRRDRLGDLGRVAAGFGTRPQEQAPSCSLDPDPVLKSREQRVDALHLEPGHEAPVPLGQHPRHRGSPQG